ncbi:MAG: hypothetical protein KGM24_00625 [Elusimicrobia bacterium]|nr:hypothetical protein [Elusimicrobiota bacterium]
MEFLTFGVSTYVAAFALMGGLRLALTFDAAAYSLAERLLSSRTRGMSFAGSFLAALTVEYALVFGALILWRGGHAGAQLARLAGGLLR